MGVAVVLEEVWKRCVEVMGERDLNEGRHELKGMLCMYRSSSLKVASMMSLS